jgi:hypothetical protein
MREGDTIVENQRREKKEKKRDRLLKDTVKEVQMKRNFRYREKGI